jgi:hypothetical protein
MKCSYTRLFADEAGESHFQELEMDLAAVNLASAAPPLLASEFFPAKQSAFFGAPAGWTSDWHLTLSRNLFVVISGAWEIQASDGTKRSFGPRDILLVEDLTGKGHRSWVLGDEESLALLVQLEK